MKPFQSLAGLMLAAVLAGCGHSPKTRILTLDMAPPSNGGQRLDYRGPPIVVPAVHVPSAVDRAEYASQPSSGEIKVDDFAHWAAPLGLLARDALVQDLIARLPAGKVAPAGIAIDPSKRVLDVTIVSIGATPDGGALQAAYRLLPGGPLRNVTVQTSGASNPIEGSRAFAQLLGLLADRIVSDLP